MEGARWVREGRRRVAEEWPSSRLQAALAVALARCTGESWLREAWPPGWTVDSGQWALLGRRAGNKSEALQSGVPSQSGAGSDPWRPLLGRRGAGAGL